MHHCSQRTVEWPRSLEGSLKDLDGATDQRLVPLRETGGAAEAADAAAAASPRAGRRAQHAALLHVLHLIGRRGSERQQPPCTRQLAPPQRHVLPQELHV